MVHQKDILAYADELALRFHPNRIILFGSYAEGRASEDSDVDLLVEMDYPGSALQWALAIRKSVKRCFPLDLIVKSPSEVKQRLAQNDFFLQSIMHQGKVLYERAG